MLPEPGDDLPRAFRSGQTGELRRVDELGLLRLRDVRRLGLAPVHRHDHAPDGKLVALRKLEVALVVGGDGHYCA